jgi:tetratricopeptide (TPR) repeat protein
VLFFSSCSTQKNSGINRAYHTVVSQYNVNFNAKEALKKGEKELETKLQDNFTMQLPVYNYAAKTDISAVYPSMDRTIEKCSKSIYKHSMFIRGKEYVKTMDDAYLMMGKAYFIKQDYNQAQRIFNYIDRNYRGKKWNCRDEGNILRARTALRLKHYGEAQTILDEFQIETMNKSKTSKKTNMLFFAASAEYQLTVPGGDPLAAIDFIHDAVKNKPDKTFKTRLYFILAQLYEENGHPAEAQKYFKRVISRTPPYNMEFNAYMHLATNYDGSNTSRIAILKNLNKMLAEKKNEEYQDQIYYAMYKIAQVDGNEEEMDKNLKLSVASYKVNGFQRTLSAITLADKYFEKEMYVEAQDYYDTALLTLPNNYPQREAIVAKGNVLRELVDNIKVIQLQDSLQKIAKMTPTQRENWVREMINKYTEEERRQQEEENNRMLALMGTADMANINTQTSNGKWYFYNQSLITAGKTDFFRNWGKRKLEDNWRISNKQQLSSDQMALSNNPDLAVDTAEYDEDGNLIKGRETDPKKAGFYTQDLPLTDSAMNLSNIQIANSLYNLSIIYLDQLHDVNRSCNSLETLLQRFPNDSLVLPSLYMLYLNYTSLHSPKADEPKNTILTKYGDTDYARLIRDPNYYKRLADQEKIMELKYESAYESYENGDWEQTIEQANQLLSQCEDPVLKSKIEYIKAVSVGQLHGKEALKTDLIKIVTNYSSTEVAGLARILLLNYDDAEEVLIAAGDSTTITKVEQKTNPFVFKAQEDHYIVVLVQVSQLSVSKVKNDIASFNDVFFSLQKFNVNSFYINANEQMITIAKFNGKDYAMDYYDVIIKNETFANRIHEGSIKIMPMSATNYTTYYNKAGERPQYQQFLKENYGIGK